MTQPSIGFRWRAPDGREGWAVGSQAKAREEAVWQALAEMRKGAAKVKPSVVEQLWRSLAAKGWQIVEAVIPATPFPQP